MLNENLDWTNSLGVAFTINRAMSWRKSSLLRHQAQRAGNLASNDKIVCREDGHQHRKCVGQSERRLCSLLQPGRGLWYVAVG